LWLIGRGFDDNYNDRLITQIFSKLQKSAISFVFAFLLSNFNKSKRKHKKINDLVNVFFLEKKLYVVIIND